MFINTKMILITGAGGFLGGELIKQLGNNPNYKIVALTSNTTKLQAKFKDSNNILYVNTSDFNNYDALDWKSIDIVVHCAFARAHKGEGSIIKSLEFTNDIFNQVSINKIPYLINISTQEVYGASEKITCIEKNQVTPKSIYGISKLFTEILTNNLRLNNHTISTSIRLAGIIGCNTDTRMVSKFVDNVIQGKRIKIVGGDQVFSQIDIRDVVEAIIAMLMNARNDWKQVYNLGYKKSYSILEISEAVVNTGVNLGYKVVDVDLDKKDTNIYVELDSSLFYKCTNWEPKHDIESTIRSVYEYKKNNLPTRVKEVE